MGRFFDRLCSVVERQFPSAELRGYLKQAVILDFPEDGATGDYAEVGGVDFVIENFSLPFPVVAVERERSLVIIADKEPGQVGLNRERIFVESFLMGDESGAGLPPTASMVSIARIIRVWASENSDAINYEFDLGMSFVADKKCVYMSPSQWRQMCVADGSWEDMTRCAAEVARSELEDLMWVTRKVRAFVKKAAEQPREKGGPEFLRSHEREHYELGGVRC